MIRNLARVPVARLTRVPRGWLPIAGWSAVGLVAALVARGAHEPNGADHVLRGTFAFAVLPLLAYGVVSAALGRTGLRLSVRGVVALGGEPATAALATSLVAMAASALASGIVAGLVALIAHGASDPTVVLDVPASFGVAFVGGAAYAAYFCAGSAIGRGAMRGVFLAADWIVGATAGFGSVFTPRAHVMSLLGGHPTFELSRRGSSVVLVVLAVVYLGLAVRLSRRAV